MNFIQKILNVMNKNDLKGNITISNPELDTLLEYNKNEAYQKIVILLNEIFIAKVNTKIDKVNELAKIINQTTDRDVFFISVEEIENILTELSQIEQNLNLLQLPSEHLRKFRYAKPKQIALLEKRISKKKNEISNSYKDCYNRKNAEKNNNHNISFEKYEVKKSEFPNIISGNVKSVDEPIEITNSVSDSIIQEDTQKREPFKYVFPPIGLLNKNQNIEKDEIERAEKLKQTFKSFGISMNIVGISKGARFTRFEIQIGQGVRIKDVLKIKDDIQLNLAANSLNLEAPIHGRTTIGIDVENNILSKVTLREIIESEEFHASQSSLTVAIGKDIAGNIIVETLEDMIHLLIAGTTGSGKSVCINSIIMSILYKADPEEVKFVLIDTNAVNLNIYNGIPNLIIPVVTDLRKASASLNWAVLEMNDRYKKFSDINVKDLKGYNKAVEMGKLSLGEEIVQKLPSIVIIIDDFSDLMIGYNNEVEESVCRLAQMGRACGIYLIISTQRPSVDVITGIIKANIPSRIAFNVFSAIDSRTIIDAKGAEKLLGNGDMLFYLQGQKTPSRIQGTYVSDSEVSDVVDFLKNQMVSNITYSSGIEEKIKIMHSPSGVASSSSTGDNIDIDAYFAEAGKLVIEKEKASIGMLQRVFKIGFNRAACIVDQLEGAGVIGAESGTKPREILMSIEQFELLLKEKYNN